MCVFNCLQYYHVCRFVHLPQVKMQIQFFYHHKDLSHCLYNPIHHPPLLRLNSWNPSNMFSTSILVLFQECYIKCSHIVCNIFGLTFLTQHNFLEIYPSYCLSESLLCFTAGSYSMVWMHVSLFNHSPWKGMRVLSSLGYYK